MTLKSDAKFEEKTDFLFENDIRNFVNFNPSSGKSKNLHFDGYFCRKHVVFESKKYRGVVSRKMI